MKRLNTRSFIFFIVLLCSTGALCAQNTSRELSVLIVTGQNNHHWPTSFKIVEQMFDQSPMFEADVVTSPANGKDMSGFIPNFAGYDLVCLDYNGERWPAKAEANLEAYVSSGGGLVVFHASDNAFADWPAYNEMIGLGGWGGRNESHGPYVYWQDGKFVRDNSPGKGGGHGQQLKFPVVTRSPNHPIMEGLPYQWMHAKDELYNRLRGPAKNLEILATAMQSSSTGGTDRHEPMLMVTRYGKGRVFHSALGHVGKNYYDSIRDVGFITTLLRGSEWAVTGAVTQTIPDDFPSATKTSIRTDLGKKPRIPNVLLIGDSISLGYTPIVLGLLDGQANVFHPENENGSYQNCAGTTDGIKNIDAWLAAGEWDVIHFNFGLHDLKHVTSTGRNSNDPDDPQQADLTQYETNLRAIVAKLKATGEKLIFATTTPYPDKPGGPLRRANQPALYNDVARRIMAENEIPLNDLHKFVLPRMEELLLPSNVHFKPSGSRALADQVVARIRRALGI